MYSAALSSESTVHIQYMEGGWRKDEFDFFTKRMECNNVKNFKNMLVLHKINLCHYAFPFRHKALPMCSYNSKKKWTSKDTKIKLISNGEGVLRRRFRPFLMV
jgi:hypothetical protein